MRFGFLLNIRHANIQQVRLNSVCAMSQRTHLTHSEAWRVVRRLKGEQTQAKVSTAIGQAQSVISKICNRFLETGNAGRRSGQGRIVDMQQHPKKILIYR